MNDFSSTNKNKIVKQINDNMFCVRNIKHYLFLKDWNKKTFFLYKNYPLQGRSHWRHSRNLCPQFHYEKLDFRLLFLPSRSLCTIPLRKIKFSISYFCSPGLCPQSNNKKFDFRCTIFALPVSVHNSITKNKILDYLFLPSRSLPTIPLRKIWFSMTYCCPPGFCPQSHYEKNDFRFPIFAFPAFVHKPITKN